MDWTGWERSSGVGSGRIYGRPSGALRATLALSGILSRAFSRVRRRNRCRFISRS